MEIYVCGVEGGDEDKCAGSRLLGRSWRSILLVMGRY